MSATIVNYIIEKFLSKIIEVDKEKIKASLLTGSIQLQNVKIKNNLLNFLFIPYFEVMAGYISTLDIKISLPFFWKDPIKLKFDKVFFRIKQISINNLDEQEEISKIKKDIMERLESIEEIYHSLHGVIDIEETFDGRLLKLIIENISLEVNDVGIFLEDSWSHPKNPYVVGILVKNLAINSGINESDDKIETGNLKKLDINSFSVFLDYSDDYSDLDFCNFFQGNIKINNNICSINDNVNLNEKLNLQLGDFENLDERHFTKEQKRFFVYANYEVEVYKDGNSIQIHNYILYDLNFHFLVNLGISKISGSLKIDARCKLEQLNINIQLPQILSIFKLFDYLKIYRLYRKGLETKYFKESLTRQEKNSYIDMYLQYLNFKYHNYNENEMQNLQIELAKIENTLTYDKIQSMRDASIIKSEFYQVLDNVQKKIFEVKDKWKIFSFFSKKEDKDRIKTLEAEKDKILQKQTRYSNVIEDKIVREKGITDDEIEKNVIYQFDSDKIKISDEANSNKEKQNSLEYSLCSIYKINLEIQNFVLNLFEGVSKTNLSREIITVNHQSRISHNISLYPSFKQKSIICLESFFTKLNLEFGVDFDLYQSKISVGDFKLTHNKVNKNQNIILIESRTLSKNSNSPSFESNLKFEEKPHHKIDAFSLKYVNAVFEGLSINERFFRIRNDKPIKINFNYIAFKFLYSTFKQIYIKSRINLGNISHCKKIKKEDYYLIEKGYSWNFLSSMTKVNSKLKSDIKLDIILKAPVIVIPITINKNEKKYFFLIRLDALEIKSAVPPKIIIDEKNEDVTENEMRIEPVLEREINEDKLKITYFLKIKNISCSKVDDNSDYNCEFIYNPENFKIDSLEDENIQHDHSDIISIKQIDVRLIQDFKQAETESNMNINIPPIYFNLKETDFEFLYFLLINIKFILLEFSEGNIKEENSQLTDVREAKEDNADNLRHTERDEEIKDQIEEMNKSWYYMTFNVLIESVIIDIMKSNTQASSPKFGSKMPRDFYKSFLTFFLNHLEASASISLSNTKETLTEISFKIFYFFLFDKENKINNKKDVENGEAILISPEFRCLLGSFDASLIEKSELDNVNEKKKKLNKNILLKNFLDDYFISAMDGKINANANNEYPFLKLKLTSFHKSLDFSQKQKFEEAVPDEDTQYTIDLNLGKFIIFLNFSSVRRIYEFFIYYYHKFSVYKEIAGLELRHIEKEFLESEEKSNKFKKESINKKFFQSVKNKFMGQKKRSSTMLNNSNFANPKMIAQQIENIQNENANENASNLPRRTSSFMDNEVDNEPNLINNCVYKLYLLKLKVSFKIAEVKIKLISAENDANSDIIEISCNLDLNFENEKKYETYCEKNSKKLIKQNDIINGMNAKLLIDNVVTDLIFKKNFSIVNFLGRTNGENLLLPNFGILIEYNSELQIEKENIVQKISISNYENKDMSLIFGLRQINILQQIFKKIERLYNHLKRISFHEDQSLEKKYKIELSKRINKEVKKQKTRKVYNSQDFNIFTELKVAIEEVSLTIIDDKTMNPPVMRALIKSVLDDIHIHFINNTDPSDADNMGKAIIEMISRKYKDAYKFNTDALHVYLKSNLNLFIIYYNDKVDFWEPLIEEFKCEISMYQVHKLTRRIITIAMLEDMININLSFISLQLLNYIITNLKDNGEDKKPKKEKEKENPFQADDEPNKSADHSVEEEEIDFEKKNYRIEVHNKTGYVAEFWLDVDINKKFKIENDQKIYITQDELEEMYKDKPVSLKENLTLHILPAYTLPLDRIDISYDHYSLNKINFIKLPYPRHKDYYKHHMDYFEISLKIRKSGYLKCICIESNLSIHNNTPFRFSILASKEHSCKGIQSDYQIKTIEPGKFFKLPLLWMIENYTLYGKVIDMDKVNQATNTISHFFEYKNKDDSDNFSEFSGERNSHNLHDKNSNINFYQIIDKDNRLLYSKLNFIYNLSEEFKNRNYYNNELEKEAITQTIANKYTKTINFRTGNHPFLLSLDVLIMKSLNDFYDPMKEPQNPLNHSTIFSYVVVLNLPLQIENNIPYPISFSYGIGDGNEKKIVTLTPLEKIKMLTLEPNDNRRKDLKLFMYYLNNSIYESDQFSFRDNFVDHKIKKVTVKRNTQKEIHDHFDISVKFYRADMAKNYKFNFLKIERNLAKSMKMIFYSDYLIVNRLDTKLYIKEPYNIKEDKELFQETHHIAFENSVNLFTKLKDPEKIVIKMESSSWSRKFKINTSGIEGYVRVKRCENEEIGGAQSENYNDGIYDKSLKKNEKTSNKRSENIYPEDHYINSEIGIKIQPSRIFEYSTLIILEPRYLIVNYIQGIKIYYRQIFLIENETIGAVYSLNSCERKMISFKSDGVNTAENKPDDKKQKVFFQISLFPFLGIQHWSQIFDITQLDDFNVNILLPQDLLNVNLDDKFIYTYDNINYYLLLRIIIHTIDNALVYIVVTYPEHPQYLIRNLSKHELTIKQKGTKELKTIQPETTVPYVWYDLFPDCKKLEVSIGNKSINFSFQKLQGPKLIKLVENIDGLNTNYFTSYFSISIENRRLTRVLQIIPEENVKKNLSIAREVFLSRKGSTRTRIEITIKGLGISVIDELPREILYLSIYSIKILQSNYSFQSFFIVENTDNLEMYIKNVQVDYCLEDSFDLIIFPDIQLLPANEIEIIRSNPDADLTPFIQLLVTMKRMTNMLENTQQTNISQIDFIMQEINCKIDYLILTSILSLFTAVFEAVTFYRSQDEQEKEDLILLKTKIEPEEIFFSKYKANKIMINNNINDMTNYSIGEMLASNMNSQELHKTPVHYDPLLSTEYDPLENLFKAANDQETIFIDLIMISNILIKLTLRIDITALDIDFIPSFIVSMLAPAGNSLARVTNAQLKLSELEIKRTYANVTTLRKLIEKHYRRELNTEFFLKVVGSSDMLGNPVGFIERISSSFKQLFNPQRKGFKKGLAKQGSMGTLALVGGITEAGLDSITRITGGLYAATRQALGEKMRVTEEERAPNILIGTYEGIKGGGKEIAKGFYNVVNKPIIGQRQQGTVGLFKGIGRGLLGLIIMPFTSTLRFTHSFLTGAKNTTGYLYQGKLETTRFRKPRYIGKGDPIYPYDQRFANMRNTLKTFYPYLEYKIIYFEDFRYFNDKYYKFFSTLIVTDVKIFVIYNKTKIIVDIDVPMIDYCGINSTLQKDVFMLVFVMKNKKSKSIYVQDYEKCYMINEMLKNIF